MTEALDLFAQAIEIDPGYALAWAGRADAYGQRAIHRWGDKQENLRLGFEAAHKAIELDPKLPDPHKAMSNLHVAGSGSVEEIRGCLEKAVEIDARYTPAVMNLGVLSVREADVAGAERRFRNALGIDAEELFAEFWLGELLVWTGRSREAISCARPLRERSDIPLYVTRSYTIELRAHRELGDLEAEVACLQGFEQDDRVTRRDRIPARANLFSRQGRNDEARTLVREYLDGPWPYLDLGPDVIGAAWRIGEREMAQEAARKMVDIEATLASILLRMLPEGLPILELEEFGPRVMDATLVWPLQATMIDEARWAVFREMKVESGRSHSPVV